MSTTLNKQYLFAPSILAANQAEIASEIKRVPGADWFHVDVMDNHFAPNMGFSAAALKSVSDLKRAPVDAHLMIENPENFLDSFINAGADSLTVHIEATKQMDKCIEIIKENKRRVGIAIKPDTKFSAISKYLDKIDMVLVMTVFPGFSGQSFLYDQVEKIKEVKKEIDNIGLDIWLQIDGGVNLQTLEVGMQAGADFFVVGSSVFHQDNPELALQNLKNLVK